MQDLPLLLRDALISLLDEMPGVELVQAPPDRSATLLESAGQTGADVVIATCEEVSDDAVRALLAQAPTSRALAVAVDGESATVFELAPRRRFLGPLTAGTLAAAVAHRQSWGPIVSEPSEPRPVD